MYHSEIRNIMPFRLFCFVLFVSISLLAGCASEPAKTSSQGYNKHLPGNYWGKRAYNRPYRVRGQTYYPMHSAEGYSEVGIASWYGPESGLTTSMGIRFNPDGYSAAHRVLPLPSKVRVTNLQNGQSIILTVNDRGPFHPGRLIDLSRGAARKIGIAGLTRVRVDYLGFAN